MVQDHNIPSGPRAGRGDDREDRGLGHVVKLGDDDLMVRRPVVFQVASSRQVLAKWPRRELGWALAVILTFYITKNAFLACFIKIRGGLFC